MGNGISPLWGLVWGLIVGVVIYLLCSLFSWNFDVHEWNWFSIIIGVLGQILECKIIIEVVRQIVTGDRFED